jgi:hemerythrin
MDANTPLVCCGEKMVEFKWDSSLEIGHLIIDAQHKELVELFATLMSAFRLGKPTDELEDALNFLCTYTVNHFNTEEIFTQSVHLKDFDRHKGLHEAFKKTVAQLVDQFKNEGPTTDLAILLNIKIGEWLITHIRQEDAKIKPYLAKG